MSNKRLWATAFVSAAFGAALFAGGAQAHECHALGQAQNEDMGQYWICVGFAVEDGFRPRAGTLNNLDFIPLWVPGNPHAEGAVASQHQLPDEPLDTRTGDTVNIRVNLVHIRGDYYDIPHDETTFRLLDDWFFLKQRGVGYSSPLATTRFVRSLPSLRPVTLDEGGEKVVTYRSRWDFVTPFPGLYAWIIEGTLRRRGQAPVTFTEKFVSAQPRIPYGPEVVHARSVDLNTLVGAPEGWFDAVKPANGGQSSAVGARAIHSSPTVSAIMKRRGK